MTITNRQIAKAFRLTSQLMELHGDNPFKIRSMQNAAFKIEKLGVPLADMESAEIATIEGIGKGLQAKISDFLSRGSFAELDDFVAKTPTGVIDMLSIKGIGPKKVLQLWQELEIESVGELLYACNENRLITLKGFGAKTQQAIQSSIEFKNSNQSNCLFPIGEIFSNELIARFEKSGIAGTMKVTGELRRKCEILTSIDLLTSADEKSLIGFLSEQEEFKEQEISFTSFQRGELSITGCTLLFQETIKVNFYLATNENFNTALFVTTAHADHLQKLKSEFGFDEKKNIESEELAYSTMKLPYFIPELREGKIEFDLARKNSLSNLIELKDLKGILHNHSTYSDGNHSLKEMAEYCKELGYEYLGICDHSKSAFYANGLKEDRILQQHAEIEKLNKALAPFKVFKGIESDILSDGKLDYEEDVLKSFDFIVASVHSNLRMDESKATQRLITAIENPYTSILGHPTGRLLLSRPGYPIDHAKVIDACAANKVSVELNANPYRLDIDWRWIQYALKKNVMISINPDAHRKEGYHDMYYGVGAARKGGLTKSMTLNALSMEEVQKYF